jgi:AcrR family transcriptional regulator
MHPTATAKPRGKRRRLAPAARRGLIEQAAVGVFAERGYETATMAEIAREAGVVASVLYDHYPSKGTLYAELLERRAEALLARSTRPQAGREGRAALRGRIGDFLAAIEADPFLWRVLFRDPPTDPEPAAAHAKAQAAAGEAIAAELMAGEALTPDEAGMAAEMARAALAGLAAWRWEHGGPGREEAAEAATILLWDGLAGLFRRSRE